jgi:phenylacetate-CoA ligase
MVSRLPRVLYYLALANRRLHWDPERMKRYQDKRFRQVVRHAYEFVPFYNRVYREAKVDPYSIKGIDDITKLPLIRKDELKRQGIYAVISKNADVTHLKRVRTSGSSGIPLEILINGAEDSWRKSIYMRANIACGQKPRDHWVILTAPHHFGDTTPLQRKLGIYAQNCISLFESNDEKIRKIEKARPDILDGYSSSLVLLAKEVHRIGLKSIKPRVMFGNAEVISVESRRFIEEVFGAPYCDQFGCAEIDRSAWECLERHGYHMDIDSVITEFLDPAGEPVSTGERGDITYTSLFNFTMPLIRYSVGDVGVPSDDVCSCGVKLPLMEVVEGRRDSFLTLPDNRLVSPFAINLEASTFKYFTSVDQYHIRQRSINSLDVYLRLNATAVDSQLIALEFEKLLRTFLNISDEVQIKTSFINELDFSSGGKLSSVTSDIKPKIAVSGGN